MSDATILKDVSNGELDEEKNVPDSLPVLEDRDTIERMDSANELALAEENAPPPARE